MSINSSYEKFYAERSGLNVYPTEFVVRTFLANYPNLNFVKPKPNDRVLDVAFGDGRNTSFLCDQGYAVSGIEITQGIVDQTSERLENLGKTADLRVGRNSSIPFEDNYFDYVLGCHCFYYCDEGEQFSDNVAEYARVLQPGGWLIASLANRASYIFSNSEDLGDGTLRITSDPYGNRNGYRLQAFSEFNQISEALDPWFENFSFGTAENDYYGVGEKLLWVVCQKK